MNDLSGRHMRHTFHYLRAWEYVRILSLAKFDQRKKPRILCLGEGSTPILFYLGKLGFEIVALDLDKKLIDNTSYVSKSLGFPLYPP